MLVDKLDSINFDLRTYSQLFDAYSDDLDAYVATFQEADTKHIKIAKSLLLSKLEEKWLPLLGFTSTRIYADIMDRMAPETKEELTSLSLKQVLNLDTHQSDWLVPNLLKAAGLYILAAPPKMGKTILLNFLIYGAAVSGEFLGKPVNKCKVLYLQLEENLSTIRTRAKLVGFASGDDETSLVVNFGDMVSIERKFDLVDDLKWLKDKIDSTGAKLVIIDSLRMATVKSGLSENSDEFGRLIYALQQVISLSEICCVLVHHMNKGTASPGSTGGSVDLIQRSAGHTSISAASDGLLGLTKGGTKGNNHLVLSTKPRDGVETEIHYKLGKTDQGLWKLDKLYEDTVADPAIVAKIVRHLMSKPGSYLSAPAIASALQVSMKDVAFQSALDYLDNSDILDKRYQSRGVTFAITERSYWIVNPSRFSDVVTPAVRDANSLMNCKTKQDLLALVSQWDSERQSEAKALLLPEERLRIKELIQSYRFQVEDPVCLVEYPNLMLGVVAERVCEGTPNLHNVMYYVAYIDGSVVQYRESQLDYYIEQFNPEPDVPATPPSLIVEDEEDEYDFDALEVIKDEEELDRKMGVG